MPSRLYRRKKRQTPPRIPYSCHAQFGTSGNSTWPVGAGRTCRAIGREMSQTSRLTIVQTTRRAPPGRRNGGRSTIAENLVRSRGIIEAALSPIGTARRDDLSPAAFSCQDRIVALAGGPGNPSRRSRREHAPRLLASARQTRAVQRGLLQSSDAVPYRL